MHFQISNVIEIFTFTEVICHMFIFPDDIIDDDLYKITPFIIVYHVYADSSDDSSPYVVQQYM